MPPSSPATPRCGRCASRGRRRRDGGVQGLLQGRPLEGTDREAEVTTFWSDVIIGRPENHMTGVSFTRGGYTRIGRNVSAGLGGYTVHRPGHWLFEGTGLGYGDVLGAGATVWATSATVACFTYRDGLPYPTGEDGTPSTFEMLGTCPTQHFHPRDSAPTSQARRAQRVGVTSHHECSERGIPRPWNGYVMGTPCWGHTPTRPAPPSLPRDRTDWAHGLAGRDPQIEQITRNGARPAGTGRRAENMTVTLGSAHGRSAPPLALPLTGYRSRSLATSKPPVGSRSNRWS